MGTLAAVSPLPSGIVTFVLTDIESSTRLLRRLGDRYTTVLDRHRELLRAAWQSNGGVEVETEGDAVPAAFGGPLPQVGGGSSAPRRCGFGSGTARRRDRRISSEMLQTARNHLGDEQCEAERLIGRQLSLPEAIRLTDTVLQALASKPVDPSDTHH